MLSTLEGLDFKARYVMEGFLNGLHNSSFHGFSVEFSDYRKYQPGDDLRHLDWRLYARSDRLCIKRYMQETNVRFYVVCDTSASMEYRGDDAWGSKLECAKVLAAALTWFLLKQNDAAGMVTLGRRSEAPEYIRPSQRPTQLGLMLRQLELLRPAGGACLGRLLQHAALLEPSEEVALGFKQLRFQGHEVIVFQILDRNEVEFPFRESKVFVDLENGARRAVSPKAVRAKYRERFNAFMAAHYELFRELAIPHCVVRTDDNPCGALALFLAERKRRS
jgi:uncharacterized protein (DUF58 family)